MSEKLLEHMKFPEDLRGMDNYKAQRLAVEVRRELIDTVSKTGGHLAPNLGVVELTIALHSELRSPTDHVIWDVSHQSYVHKMLTGRYSKIDTLRQYGGICGFTRRDESCHDIFGAGHSSTSISAATGIAISRDMKGLKNVVAAVIGDGALTGGMAYEALNYVGHLKSNLIVILNDNEMSISPNVGAMSSYLYRIRMDPTLNKVKTEVELALKKIPAIGRKVAMAVDKTKEAVKYLIVPGMIFEELGFTYIGPIDGHNIASLRRSIRDAKSRGGPVLIHVVTIKGKGYAPAEESPEKFHGTSPFSIVTGNSLQKQNDPTFTEIFSKSIVKLAFQDHSLVGITAAMPDGTGLCEFYKRFPDRFFDVGIAEQHGVTMAAGMAVSGYRPVIAIYSTFMQRAYDQMLHDVCLQNLPVIFAMDRAGIVGEDGATHHGVFDIAYCRHIPNMTIMAPKNGPELKAMLEFATKHNGPVSIRYPRATTISEGQEEAIEYGKAQVLKEGNDIAILAIGTMVDLALEGAKKLEESGVEATVVNMRFIKPLDEELLNHIADNIGRVITIEEHVLSCGFGSAVLEYFEEIDVDISVKRMGIPNEFIQHGPRNLLLDKCGLSVDKIVEKVYNVIGKPICIKAGMGG